MLWQVVDLEFYAVVIGPLHGVRRGQRRIEIENRSVHLVVEAATPVVGPFALEIPRRDRDLVGTGARRLVEGDPVGFARDVAVLPHGWIVDALHARLRL